MLPREERAFSPKSAVAVLPSEAERALHDLLHQLERLLYHGLHQGSEVHHAHVHLQGKQTYIISLHGATS